MDGSHYDNAILPDLNTLDRKGAPNTFDAEGLRLLRKDHSLPNAGSRMTAAVTRSKMIFTFSDTGYRLVLWMDMWKLYRSRSKQKASYR